LSIARSTRRRHLASLVLAVAVGGASSLPAQEPTGFVTQSAPVVVTAAFDGGAWIPADSSIAVTLSRSPSDDEGRIAVVVGTADLTPLFERTGRSLRFRGRTVRLPAGQSDVTVYVVKTGRWTELARFPIRVLTPSGFATAVVKPGFSLSSKGQIAEGHSGAQVAPQPATYQDVGFSGGLQSTHERGRWTLRTQSNYLGASRRQEALRYGIRQDEAPKVDLADYLVQLQRGPATLSLGHVTEGANRHLINAFASRGVEMRVGGAAASVALAALNGSSVVGWDNITGLNDGNHRVTSGTLNVELVPRRPGAVHIDATLMRGSLLPQTSFSQGAVVDAERSTGTGVQLAAATPSQRLRLAAGVSRSRFDNPTRDAELLGDTNVVRVRSERRSAMYVEMNAGLLQNVALPHLFATTLNATYRLERVDPMYRSVAATTQSDRLFDAYELSGNLGAVAIQLVRSRDHDNLDDLASVLRTHNRISTANVSAPISALLRAGARAALFPVVTYGFNRVHQYGGGIPLDADFSASHVPDQRTDVHAASAAWQLGRWRVQYRFNQSNQDNRQTGRERADFLAASSTLGVDVAARSNLDVGIEASAEHQTARESAETNRVRRAGGTVTWRATPLTTLTAFGSSTMTRNDPLTSDADNWDLRLELARGFDLWRLPDGKGTRGQLFLRYAHASGNLMTFPVDGPLLREERGAWTLTSGLTFRLY
jgi:hypothetical protein